MSRTVRMKLLGSAGLVAALVLALVVLRVPGAFGAYSARITNSNDSVGTNAYFTCKDGVTTAGSVAYVAYALNDTAYPTSPTSGAITDVTGNSRTGLYTRNATNGGITYGVTGPCTNETPNTGITLASTAVTQAYVSGPSTAFTLSNFTSFTEQIWFKTTTAGGKLVGFGNLRTGSSTQYDRHIYLTNAGNLVFGVYPGSVKTIQSSATYLDNTWHLVTASLGAAGTTYPGMRLYVDGTLVASDTTTTTAEGATSEFWRIGYDNISSWGTTQPTNFFFNGSLAYPALWNTVLTPAQVAAEYQAAVG